RVIGSFVIIQVAVHVHHGDLPSLGTPHAYVIPFGDHHLVGVPEQDACAVLRCGFNGLPTSLPGGGGHLGCLAAGFLAAMRHSVGISFSTQEAKAMADLLSRTTQGESKNSKTIRLRRLDSPRGGGPLGGLLCGVAVPGVLQASAAMGIKWPGYIASISRS